jgi:arsenate reductase|tara:strand:+ start:12363 stop:12647 length:285 start_codon:yes stop_codon:yes gene_type:complete
LEEKNEDISIIKYLEEPPTKKELKQILELLNIKPIALVRKNEQIWKDNFKGKDLSQDEVIDAMIANPKLIERPIVVKNNKATIGRPPENVLNIL